MTKLQVVAHRGSSEAYAENGWPAFEAAVAEGADAIECDVQATRDGVLVIRHDLAIGSRLVAEVTATELDALEPGVVRFAELLTWAPRARIGLLVELKDPDIAGKVGDTVAVSPWCERIVIGSFHGPALAVVKTRTPTVKTSLMMGSVLAPEDFVRLAKVYRADGVHPCWEARAPHPHRLLDDAAISCFRDARLAITLWNETRETELRSLVRLCPDAICTDTPAKLRRIVDAAAMTATSAATPKLGTAHQAPDIFSGAAIDRAKQEAP